MEHTNSISPLQTDRNERQPKMDPREWLLKVAIVRIELEQKDPTFSMRSLPPGHIELAIWRYYRSFFLRRRSSSGDRLGLAFEIAVLDFVALDSVMERVEKNDNLREVLARALRSTPDAFLHAGSCSEYAYTALLTIFGCYLRDLVASRPGSKQEYIDASDLGSELAIAYTFHAFLTSVLHLLTSVFRYLSGYVDRGGSKTYSSGAFDFRASFVALVLFQGAYVWIKFRQAARPGCRKRKAPDVEHEVVDIETCNLKGVYARPIKEKSCGAITHFKYEPRFTPPREEGDDDTDKCSKRLPLGEYHTRAEAQIVRHIARYYYDKDGGCVELEDGRYEFPIPPMSEQERGLAGQLKRKWVSRTAKQVGKQMYADFERAKGKHLAMATEAVSHGTELNDPSSSALPFACSPLPMLTTMAAEPAIGSAAPSSPMPPFDGAIVGAAADSSESLFVFEGMLAEPFYDPGLPSAPDQQSSFVSYHMQYQGFAELPGDPISPEVGAVPGCVQQNSEPELNPSPSFHQGRDLANVGTENIDGSVSLPQSVPDLQQLVLCQKKWMEDNARQFVKMDHELKACQIQNLKLQQEKEQWQQENESLKSRLQQVASSQIATWTGVMMDIQQEGLNDFGFLEE